MRTFGDLQQAVRFLADALDNEDRDGLAAATPLPQLYAGRTFPLLGTSFKLGGHDRELGHIHIDFVRTESGWELERIWMCR